MAKATWRRHDLAAALREGGLPGRSPLVVHSSLSSLGRVEGGAATVVKALLDALGEGATLMAPTFNYLLQPGESFDPATTRGLTGAIPEALRGRPDAVRSLHPTYSVAALGKLAAALTDRHWEAEPVGIGSPLDRLAAADGWVLLLGVHHDANSMLHVGEAHAGARYRGIPYDPAWPRWARLRLPPGRIVEVDLRLEPGCSSAFGVAELPLRENKAIIDFKLGTAKCQLMPARQVIEAAVKLIRKRPDILLCSNPRCRFCPPAREAARY